MDYDTYSSTAIELAVDLANSAYDEPSGPVEFMAAHRDWFSTGAELGLTAPQARKVAALAARVREVFVVADTGEQAAISDGINALLGDVTVTPRLTDHDGTLHVHYSDDGAPAVQQLATSAAVGMALLVARFGWQRMGVCHAADCADVFVDTSRNNSRRYCSDTCASRSTVAAYRARKRDV